jgi:hypothetical protein
MNERIIQIISAPEKLFYCFEGGKAQPVACLALVELSGGDREVRAFGVMNGGIFEDVATSGAVLFFD